MSASNVMLPPTQPQGMPPSTAEVYVYQAEQTIWRWIWLFGSIVLMLVVIAILFWLGRKSLKSLKGKKHWQHELEIERRSPYGTFRSRPISVEEEEM